MGAIRLLTIPVLLGLVVLAHITLAKQTEWNGSFNLETIFTYTNRILPNSKIPIKIPLTGHEIADNYFAFMTSFFWHTLDARNIRAHLQGNLTLGTLSSIGLLMLNEAHRGQTGVVFFVLTYFLEVMGELLGIGLCTPIWCTLHLLLTKTPKGKGLFAPAGQLWALGCAIVTGHVVPTILMLRTKPDGEGILSQQLWIVLRLFHPVLVFASFKVFQVIGSLFSSSATGLRSTEQAASSTRKIYLFSILASAFFHVTTMAILLAPEMFPDWIRPEVTAALDLKTFFIPVTFYPAAAVKQVTFVESVAIFLQWDNLCAAAAITVWASSLYLEAASLNKVKAGSSVNTFVQGLLVAILAGPPAAAAFFVMERDTVVIEAVGERKEGKKN